MKPDDPCPNHPDTEAFFTCAYCGKDFCESCTVHEKGFDRCRGPECVKAYEADLAGPKRPCHHCGAQVPVPFPACTSCGKGLPRSVPVDSDGPVTVRKFFTLVDAQMARAKLESEGIEAFVADETISTIYSTGVFLGGIRLQVRASDKERAQEILERPEPEVPEEAVDAGASLGLDESRPEPRHTQGVPLGEWASGQGEAAGPAEGIVAGPPPAEKGKWSLSQMFCLWTVLMMVEVTAAFAYIGVRYFRGFLPSMGYIRWFYHLGEAAGLLLIWYWTRRFQGLSWRDSLRFLGFKKPNPSQLLAAVLILSLLLLRHFLAMQDYFREGHLLFVTSDWQGSVLRYLFTAGLFEETFIRGFLFRFFRQGRSFLAAACLSSALWALSHWSHLFPTYGPLYWDLPEKGKFFLAVFVDGLVGAYLFEKGGWNIWGYMLVHVGYDSMLLVDNGVGDVRLPDIPRIDWFWRDMLLTAFSFLIIRWVLPEETESKGEGHPLFPDPEAARRWDRPAWTAVLLGVLGLILSFGPIQDRAIAVDDLDWQRRMDARPRFADGYRQWAYDLWCLEKDKEAEEKVQKALAIDPRSDKAWFLWGKILLYEPKGPVGGFLYEDAAKNFSKAAALAPRNPAYYLLWARALERTDDHTDLFEEYHQVLRLSKDEDSMYIREYANKCMEYLERR